jgi:hypothetical protein
MGNALDAFRAQQKAAETLHARLTEVSALVSTLLPQLDRLRIDQALKETFAAETKWLAKVEDLVRDVREFREVEFRRFRVGVVWRWALACLFALAAMGVGQAAYVWAEKPYAEELERLRAQGGFADAVQRRMATMTPAERQQFDRLMKLK